MPYSTTGKFIFIHVPKTAGLSMQAALSRYNEMDPLVKGLKAIQHATAKETRNILRWRAKKEWTDFWSFCFVRNPWERVLSMCFYLNPSAPFKDTLLQLNFASWMARPQVDYVFDEDGSQMVNFVGRFETLKDDWSVVCEKLGVQMELPHENKSEHGWYRDYYDDLTRNIVASHHRADIEAFGYTF